MMAISQVASLDIRLGASGLMQVRIDIRPPKLDKSFNLYAIRLKTYLTRLRLWGIVDGTETRDANVVVKQSTFDERDNAARDVILNGMPESDAVVLCRIKTAHEMWNKFKYRKQQTEYTSYIFTKQKFLNNKFTNDKSMDDWLQEMQLLRQTLSDTANRPR